MIVVFTPVHFVSEMAISENTEHRWIGSWTKEPWVAAAEKLSLSKPAISTVIQAIMLQWPGMESLPNPIASLRWQAGQSHRQAEGLSYMDVCTTSTGLIRILQLADCTFLWG